MILMLVAHEEEVFAAGGEGVVEIKWWQPIAILALVDKLCFQEMQSGVKRSPA
jgi:hypothetical protein